MLCLKSSIENQNLEKGHIYFKKYTDNMIEYTFLDFSGKLITNYITLFFKMTDLTEEVGIHGSIVPTAFRTDYSRWEYNDTLPSEDQDKKNRKKKVY